MPPINPQVIEEASKSLGSQRDRDFLLRVWNTDPEVYQNRLRAIGFTHCSKVLDAGAGFGQWSHALAALNESVCSLEFATERVATCRLLQHHSQQPNWCVSSGDLQQLDFPPNHFDAVFSYSVLYLTDYRKSLSEIHRVLKPQGRLYLSTNDIGWYLFNLVEAPNPSADFDPRQMAAESLARSLDHFRGKTESPPPNVIMPIEHTLSLLAEIGFEIRAHGPDGSINSAGIAPPPKAFYPSHYLGFPSVYEVLCEKI